MKRLSLAWYIYIAVLAALMLYFAYQFSGL